MQEIQKMKLRFYDAMVTLDINGANYLEVARHYRHIADTPIVRANPVKLQNVRSFHLSIVNLLYGSAPADNPVRHTVRTAHRALERAVGRAAAPPQLRRPRLHAPVQVPRQHLFI